MFCLLNGQMKHGSSNLLLHEQIIYCLELSTVENGGNNINDKAATNESVPVNVKCSVRSLFVI